MTLQTGRFACAVVLAGVWGGWWGIDGVGPAFAADPVATPVTVWTQFRGPQGAGLASAITVPNEMTTENIAWQVALPGRGYSSPVLEGNLAWMTAARVRELTLAEAEAIRETRYADHMLKKSLVIVGDVTFSVLAVDVESGQLVHQRELFTLESPAPVHSLNSYASPTPVVHAGRLYCHFGSYGTVCIDTTTTQTLWRETLPLVESVGPGSSPILYEDLLIVPCDGVDVQYVAALDVQTGAVRWKTPRPPLEAADREYLKSFSVPVLVDDGARSQVLVMGAQWVCGYDPRDGRELWRIRHGQGFSSSVVPVLAGNSALLCTGYGGGALLAINPQGTGDVTETHIRWTFGSKGQVPTMPSPVSDGSQLFMVSDSGVANCIDVSTGESVGRSRVGGNFSSSLLLADQRLFVANREGLLSVLGATPEMPVLGTLQLDSAVMASPVPLGQGLLVRTEKSLYRLVP